MSKKTSSERPDLKVVKLNNVESFTENTYVFGCGSVTVRSNDQVLTAERALWLLESTKKFIV